MSNGLESAYGGACRKDVPYPSVSNESVPSLIDNLVTALYGDITKVVANRRVQWVIPCDPVGAPATVFNIPRNAGEGLLCYFIRAFNATGTGGVTFYGSFVGPLTGNLTGNASGTSSGLIGGLINSLVYQSAPNTTAFLPIGSNGQVLGTIGSGLQWVSAPAASTSSAIAGGAAGQVIWQSASNTTGFTAVGSTNQLLHSNGTSVPTWSSVVAGDLAATLDLSSKTITYPSASIAPSVLTTGKPVWDSAGNVGIKQATPAVSLDVNATDAIKIPVGITGDRPIGASGYIRYNSTLGKFEGYGSAWGNLGGGAQGGGTDSVFYENDSVVTTDYTITTNKNAMTAGPVSVNSGVTVTIPSGSVWTVV